MDKNYHSSLSIFAHELKSPLNIILNLAKLIELGLKKKDEEKIKKYIALIISQAIYMKNYISNTIEMGKIKCGNNKTNIEEVDLVDLINEIAVLTQILIENKPISVKTEFFTEKCIVLSNYVKLKQVLLNIASNSAKFTKNGHIIFVLQQMDDMVLIEIHDTGIGFNKTDLDQILNSQDLNSNFNQRIFESSGLGLYITTELLKTLNGSMTIDSKHGKGTKVYISIPKKTSIQ